MALKQNNGSNIAFYCVLIEYQLLIVVCDSNFLTPVTGGLNLFTKLWKY
jgi:hypothetical protein